MKPKTSSLSKAPQIPTNCRGLLLKPENDQKIPMKKFPRQRKVLSNINNSTKEQVKSIKISQIRYPTCRDNNFPDLALNMSKTLIFSALRKTPNQISVSKSNDFQGKSEINKILKGNIKLNKNPSNSTIDDNDFMSLTREKQELWNETEMKCLEIEIPCVLKENELINELKNMKFKRVKGSMKELIKLGEEAFMNKKNENLSKFWQFVKNYQKYRSVKEKSMEISRFFQVKNSLRDYNEGKFYMIEKNIDNIRLMERGKLKSEFIQLSFL